MVCVSCDLCDLCPCVTLVCMYYDDAMMQAEAQGWADAFNKRRPPKEVQFLTGMRTAAAVLCKYYALPSLLHSLTATCHFIHLAPHPNAHITPLPQPSCASSLTALASPSAT